MLSFTPTHLIIAFRILLSLLTRTTFQPDEYYQSLEPAHHIVFGYGHLTWEWLSPQPIRSIFYPLFDVLPFIFLKWTGLHSIAPWLVVYTPKVVHGAFAAITDIYVFEIAKRYLGVRYALTAQFLSLTSFFHALSLSRSLSNSLETSLCAVAFTYYPWDVSSKQNSQLLYYRPRFRVMVAFAALACMVRPTNAVIWAFLFSRFFWALRSSPRACWMALSDASLAFIMSLFSLFVLDSLYYGKPTFTPYNFLKANASNVSVFYGLNTWHYYFSQALPILTTTALPFVIVHAFTVARGRTTSPVEKNLWSCIIWTALLYSMAGHKEWRFLHPVLPLLHVCAAKTLVDLSSSRGKELSSLFAPPIRTRYRNFILLNFPVAAYIVLLYCSGPISVMGFIRNLPSEELTYGTAVGFLMPCHSTPMHAYLHRPELAEGNMWAIGCEPPLRNENLETYYDQTKIFFKDPLLYFSHHFPKSVNTNFPKSAYPATPPGSVPSMNWRHEWPKHLVLFGALLDVTGVRDVLQDLGYEEVWSAGRWWEGDEDERKGSVRVWKFTAVS
ncbi:glycosyltransferase family 22 protein [Flagelloscypha sp. PMI_526]|nr:glycosyltransferase family 22 protein [Flagelloscypha sp. PMI_526]